MYVRWCNMCIIVCKNGHMYIQYIHTYSVIGYKRTYIQYYRVHTQVHTYIVIGYTHKYVHTYIRRWMLHTYMSTYM